jgi:site-specific DNA-methyltransferase (adenine-specific)
MIDLLRGNCMELLKDVVPDVVLTDPPYSEHVHKSATSCGTPGARPSAALKGAAHRDLGFAHLGDELRQFICRLAARTRRWSAIFTDTESVGDWKAGLEAAGATYIRSIPWVRWSMPQLSGDRPPQGHEMIVLAWGSQKGKKSWNGPGNLTHFAHTCMRGDGKHKAQKPLDLMCDLTEYFSNGCSYETDNRNGFLTVKQEGDLVIDPCMGSGTTAFACTLLGRNFIGCEQDAVWYEKACARLGMVAHNVQDVNESVPMYDDEERYVKYLAASAKRRGDMKRMAENTARIRRNREAAEAGGT